MEWVMSAFGAIGISRNKPMTALSDEAIIKKILDGDRDAYRELLKRYERPVYTLCLRMMGHAQDAEDCAQTAFVKVYSALNTFREGRSFRSWIYRIATNACIDAQRRARVRPANDGVAEEDYQLEWMDTSPGPREVASLSELRSVVKQALSYLDEKYRTPLILFYHEGLDCSEIAAMLSLNMGTVKTRMRRGRLLLKETISQKWPDLVLPEVEIV